MGPMMVTAAVASVVMVALIILIRHRIRRRTRYRELAASRAAIVAKHPICVAAEHPERYATEFEQQRLVRVAHFVKPESLEAMKQEALANLHRVERTYIPTHKKGGTVSYEAISCYAPHCLSFYHSPEVQRWISCIVGVTVYPTPERDQSSLSLLCYTEPGDHINWHYDHNFYKGRHFTVLLPLVNQGPDGGCSRSQLEYKVGQQVQVCDTSPNSLVVFEGARVLHRATPTQDGDLRIMLSMTYCSDPRNSWWKEFIRRVKDTAFFGIRALWD
ncbi:MAG: hypothetical protein KatS3mg113_0148 [Planctomycetaceae bacterium]|nr:MAG: hypothetical protein KatS3mg113_0148 [Planctomycetaceae bacterium]